MIQRIGERQRRKVNFNTPQSEPCGALLVCCCHSCCIGGQEGHGDPGVRGTGHRSLTSLKSISWQLAGGKLAISNHQVPDHFTHIFQNLFSNCSQPFLPVCLVVAIQRTDQLGWCMAPHFWKGWKSPTSPARPLPCPQGHQALHQASNGAFPLQALLGLARFG